MEKKRPNEERKDEAGAPLRDEELGDVSGGHAREFGWWLNHPFISSPGRHPSPGRHHPPVPER